jgi:hypothetical protein
VPVDRYWILTFVLTLFAIHLGRWDLTEQRWDLPGLPGGLFNALGMGLFASRLPAIRI